MIIKYLLWFVKVETQRIFINLSVVKGECEWVFILMEMLIIIFLYFVALSEIDPSVSDTGKCSSFQLLAD